MSPENYKAEASIISACFFTVKDIFCMFALTYDCR